MAAAVNGLVIEAMLNLVSTETGISCSTSAKPYAFSKRILPSLATRTAAPGWPGWITLLKMSSTTLSVVDDCKTAFHFGLSFGRLALERNAGMLAVLIERFQWILQL